MEAAVLRTLELTFRCHKIWKVIRQRASTVDIWFRLARQSYNSGFILESAAFTFLSGEVLDIFKAAVIIHRYKWGGVTGINATRSAMCHSMSSEVIGVASAGLNLLFTPFYSWFFQICPQLTRKSQFLLFPPVFGRHSVIYLLRRNHSSSLDEDLRGVTLMRPSLLYSSNLYLLCISVPQGFPPSSSARRRLHIWLWPWVTCRALWTSLDIFNGLAYLLSMLMNKN